MVAIRELQHYLYCPHRWGMLYLDGQWEDNSFTVIAELKHQRVHSEKVLKQTGKIISLGGVTVYSSSLGIYGKCDCLEFIRDSGGVFISELGGIYVANIIEYKPTAPKSPSAADRLQLYAQYCCLKEILGTEVNAYLYYSDIRRRELLKFNTEDAVLLKSLVEEINAAVLRGSAPPPEYGKKCNGCSVKDRCMPRVTKVDVRSAILRGIYEETS